MSNHLTSWRYWRHLLTALLLGIATLLTSCMSGSPKKETRMPDVGIPPIDRISPATYETATFALG